MLIHGNLATSRFYEHVMVRAPERYRCIAPDMRGFGDTERVPIDATRGLRDWADDTFSLVRALGITQPVHLVGWSTGGAAIANYAQDRPVASLTFVDPVSPYGFGGVRLDGTPCFPDYAGSGGGTGNAEFAQHIAAHDTSSDSALSPRNVMNSSYWAPTHREPADREDMLVDEINKSETGDDGYPGDTTTSENWPGIAPGTRGILNALSGNTATGPASSTSTPSLPCCGRTAAPTSSCRTAPHGRWARSARWASSLAGLVTTFSHRSRWWRRFARCSSAIGTPVVA